jgi:toxin-antitoxin system PIN domain toxin
LSKPWLLDVNVLLAWLWPSHQAHKAAHAWMRSHGHESWATCPITEMGFLRIITNPSFSPHVPAWSEAVEVLNLHTDGNRHHSFWQDTITLDAVNRQLGSRIKGSSQVTDAYLLALAMDHKGKMVTFDFRMANLAPTGSAERDSLQILRLE